MKKKKKTKFHKSLKFVTHQLWRLYETFRTLIVWPIEHRTFDPLRKSLIHGKRVLILGSGPSLKELSSIPSDVCILACKGTLTFFKENMPEREIDLYMNCRGALQRYPEIEKILPGMRINLFVMDDLPYIKRQRNISFNYKNIIPDDGKDNFYFRKITGWKEYFRIIRTVEPFREDGKKMTHVSSGMRLLQYALYFGASEIYLQGIDLNHEGYFWGQKKKQKHLPIDHAFMQFVSSKYENIYSSTDTSPITRYIPYKPLSEVSQTGSTGRDSSIVRSGSL